jgi:hypothetical protein
MHHFMQKHMTTSEEVPRILHFGNVVILESLLHFGKLLVDSCRGEEDWTHCDIVVFITKPAVVSPSITSNLLSLLLDVAIILSVFATDGKVVVARKLKVSCSADIV